MTESEDENAFTKLLTTAADDMPKVTRQQSWLESVRRRSSLNDTGMMKCPSCRGTGVNENIDTPTELVALMPYNDERLKPRRTKCKLLFALLVCAVILGVGTYIFLPGKVTITTTNITIVRAAIAKAKTYTLGYMEPTSRSNITWQVNVTVQNKNRFLPITISTLNITLKRDAGQLTQVGVQTFGNFSVAGNVEHTASYNITTPEYGDHAGGYNDNILNCRCCNEFRDEWGNVYMIVSLTLHYSLNIGKFKYFSTFVSSDFQGRDNCNYFKNVGGVKNITCEEYNSCWKHSNLYNNNNGEVLF